MSSKCEVEKVTREMFMEWVNDMLKEIEGWKNEPDNPELVRRIMKKATSLEKKRQRLSRKYNTNFTDKCYNINIQSAFLEEKYKMKSKYL